MKMNNTNIQQAIQNHLKVGAYFFSSAISTEEIDEEVDLALSKIKGYKIQMPVVFDMEEFDQGGRIDDLSIEQRTNLALRFCCWISTYGIWKYDLVISKL